MVLFCRTWIALPHEDCLRDPRRGGHCQPWCRRWTLPVTSLTRAVLPLTERYMRSLSLWGLGARRRGLLARRTDPHLPTFLG